MAEPVPEREIVAETYDILAEAYDTSYLDPKDLAENSVVRRLTRALVETGQVLDVGCGTGLLLELHDVDPTRYLGFDISAGMLTKARAKFPKHRFVQADQEENWPNGRFDSVLALFETFNYSLQPELTVRQLADHLWPGGRFFFMVGSTRQPSRFSSLETRVVKGQWVPDLIGLDLPRRLYCPDDLRQLFNRPEFVGVRVRGFSRYVDLVRYTGSVALCRAALSLEVATLLRARPDMAYYLLVTGTRASTPLPRKRGVQRPQGA